MDLRESLDPATVAAFSEDVSEKLMGELESSYDNELVYLDEIARIKQALRGGQTPSGNGDPGQVKIGYKSEIWVRLIGDRGISHELQFDSRRDLEDHLRSVEKKAIGIDRQVELRGKFCSCLGDASFMSVKQIAKRAADEGYELDQEKIASIVNSLGCGLDAPANATKTKGDLRDLQPVRAVE
ncbi:MAG: hypothetical protein KDD68_20210 [Bdellovibrionales bacterium]|nr:hypothetical protein [Bdellovibrionales bacterium]